MISLTNHRDRLRSSMARKPSDTAALLERVREDPATLDRITHNRTLGEK